MIRFLLRCVAGMLSLVGRVWYALLSMLALVLTDWSHAKVAMWLTKETAVVYATLARIALREAATHVHATWPDWDITMEAVVAQEQASVAARQPAAAPPPPSPEYHAILSAIEDVGPSSFGSAGWSLN
jgi:hypothetical protein